jgi:predicted unusual protein kinase regulating ubiquinone biosynthesis (AarF/ABC1/UbiB family)
MDTYLKQIFEDGFFHADPHPGNLFVTPVPASGRRAAGWRLTFVDFGMVGSVPQSLRAGLRDLVIGLGTRNPRRIASAYQALGILLPGADMRLIELAEAQILERFWGKSMSELIRIGHEEMHQIAHQFRSLIYDMPFQLPHNLLLLGRTIGMLSGMCTGLDPELNVWTAIAPYARKLVQEEVGPDWQAWLEEFGEMGRELLSLPRRVGAALDLAGRGGLSVNVPQVSLQIHYLEMALNRLMGGLVFTSFLFTGLFLFSNGARTGAYLCWGAAGLSLLWSVFLARGHAP